MAILEKRIDLRWRDLDAYGHVNQAVYLTFAEEVLDHWFQQKLGMRPGTVWDYVAARTTIEYRSELRLVDAQAVGSVSLVRLGSKSVTARTSLCAPDGRLAAEVESVVVVIDGQGGPSRALTPVEREALSEPDTVTEPRGVAQPG
jgi:acyl-CoA thioester hydrolase